MPSPWDDPEEPHCERCEALLEALRLWHEIDEKASLRIEIEHAEYLALLRSIATPRS